MSIKKIILKDKNYFAGSEYKFQCKSCLKLFKKEGWFKRHIKIKKHSQKDTNVGISNKNKFVVFE